VHVRVVLDWCVTVPSLYGQCSRQPWYRVHNVGGKTNSWPHELVTDSLRGIQGCQCIPLVNTRMVLQELFLCNTCSMVGIWNDCDHVASILKRGLVQPDFDNDKVMVLNDGMTSMNDCL